MANHHDNLDLWASKHHPVNARTTLPPKRKPCQLDPSLAPAGSSPLPALAPLMSATAPAATDSRTRVTNPEPAQPIPPGPFAPTWESLRTHYRAPARLVQGKFGIFLHWGL